MYLAYSRELVLQKRSLTDDRVLKIVSLLAHIPNAFSIAEKSNVIFRCPKPSSFNNDTGQKTP